MTTDIETGSYTAEQAEALVQEIVTTLEGLATKAVEAYHGRVWLALGYGSWEDLAEARFIHVRALFDVAELKAAGLSTRATAQLTGRSKSAVARVEVPLPQDGAPTPIKGLDGRSYRAADPGRRVKIGGLNYTVKTGPDGEEYVQNPFGLGGRATVEEIEEHQARIAAGVAAWNAGHEADRAVEESFDPEIARAALEAAGVPHRLVEAAISAIHEALLTG